jgi:type II secretory pathway pseudopilin PulG
VNALLRRYHRALAGDDGMTTIELIVAMGIFTVVCTVFLSGVVMMTRSTVRDSSQSNAMDASRIVFQRLDRQVRYAEAINTPGNGGSGAQYVEWRISATVSTTGVARCYQWRYDPATATLASRTWNDTAGNTPGGFTTIATDVQPAAAGYYGPYPFVFTPASAAQTRQQLTMRLRTGASVAKVTVDTQTNFVARNSSAASQTNTLNGLGQSSAPVCLSVATRP